MRFADLAKAFVAAALISAATLAAAALPVDPFSRWTPKPVEGAERLKAGGPNGATVVVLRRDMAPLRSFDGGATWTPFALPSGAYEVEIAPAAARTWYAFANDGLHRTVDGGDTWQLRSPPLAAPLSSSALSISADADVLYRSAVEHQACEFICVPKSAQLQVSRDGGLSWRDIGTQTAYQRAFASPVDSRLVFALGTAGLLRSTDYGASWTTLAVSSSVPATLIQYGALTLDRHDSAIAYLRTMSNNGTPPVFATRDGGQTWTARNLPPAGNLYADPGQPGRAYLFATFDGAFETRDAGSSWVHVEPFFRWGLTEYVDGVTMREGRRFGLNAEFLMLKELDLNDGALALRSDLWWNPQEPGTGLTITHRASNQTFVVWYGYDAAGAPVWRVMPGGRWNDRTFTGDVYETTGPAFFGAVFDPSRVVARRVGTAQLRFDNENSADFSYQLASGESGSKRIQRQLFGPPVTLTAADDNFADLWWNAAEPGWGIAINHQYDNIFAAWYAYDAQGHPVWVVMPDAKVALPADAPRASGDIYTTHGPSSTEPFDPSKVVASKVGTASITFVSLGEAVLESTAFGRTEVRRLTRQPF
jgi:photosystem II stability/assembly factor-like uncharacterized protein